MKVTPINVTIGELIVGYEHKADDETGVYGYGGRLNIRPPYQREFVYDRKDERAVIHSVLSGFPLNSIYWAVQGNNMYEVIDGQQRILSICRYHSGVYHYNRDKLKIFFENLTPEEQQQFLNYKLNVYVCEGSEAEKLKWFEVINTAGERLSKQELRNAVYHGSWCTDAKKRFSKINCIGAKISEGYIEADITRQGLLETALKWISNDDIEGYMAEHQHDETALELWSYFTNVIDWVKTIFPVQRTKLMSSVPWGPLYRQHGKDKLNPKELEQEIQTLLDDDEVAKKNGIYEYVLTRDKKYLNFRAFLQGDKRKAYAKQKGICPHCHKHYEYNQMEGDHVVPWSQGGKTVFENLQMLCRECNRRKGNR